MEGIDCYAPVEWARFGPAHNNEVGEVELPFAVWRFKRGSEYEARAAAVAGLIEECIGSFDSEIGWIFEKPNRNWVLTTASARSEWETGRYSNDSEMRSILAREQPHLGIAANAEFARLVSGILRVLEERLGPPG